MKKIEMAMTLEQCLKDLESLSNERDPKKQGRLIGMLKYRLESAYDFYSKPQNVRKAGAKPKVNPLRVVKLKRAGKSYRAIAEELGISHGIAHKLYHENKNLNDEYIEEYMEEFDYCPTVK